MTVRKNFVFDEEVARHLEEIAKSEGKTQTQVAQEAIEKAYKDIEREKKLEALNAIKGCATGLIGDVDAKEARIEYLMEKHGY